MMQASDRIDTRPGWRTPCSLALLLFAAISGAIVLNLFAILFVPISRDVGLSDVAVGTIFSYHFGAFSLLGVLSLLISVAVAIWADAGNRKLVLLISIALYSIATAATGLAQDMASLAAAKMAVVLGVSMMLPVAISTIFDLSPPTARPAAISIIRSASLFSAVIGMTYVATLNQTLGWRSIFFLCGAISALLVPLLLFMWQRPPQAVSIDRRTGLLGIVATFDTLFRTPGLVWLMLGFGLTGATAAGLGAWAPALFIRSYAMSIQEMSATFAWVGIASALSMIAFGILASILSQRSGKESSALLVPLICLPAAAASCALLLFASSTETAVLAYGLTLALVTSAAGACLAVALGAAPLGSRTVAAALMLVAYAVLGAMFVPRLIVSLSDQLGSSAGAPSLKTGLWILPLALVTSTSLLALAKSKIVTISEVEMKIRQKISGVPLIIFGMICATLSFIFFNRIEFLGISCYYMGSLPTLESCFSSTLYRSIWVVIISIIGLGIYLEWNARKGGGQDG